MGVKAVIIGSARRVNNLGVSAETGRFGSGGWSPIGRGSAIGIRLACIESRIVNSRSVSELGGSWSIPRGCGGGSGVRAANIGSRYVRSIGISVLSGSRITARGF
jgi:hypothetical protein